MDIDKTKCSHDIKKCLVTQCHAYTNITTLKINILLL